MSDTSSVDPSAATPGTPGTDSVNGGLDVATLMKGFQGAMSQFSASKTDLNNALAQAQGASELEQFGIGKESEANQEINTIQGAAKAKEIAANRLSAAHFGTNPDASSYIIGLLGDSVVSDEADIAQRRDMLQQKADLGFTDNPLQWIMNQITMPMDAYAANIKIAGVNQKLDIIHQLEQATREQAATNAVLDQGDAVKIADQQNQILAARSMQAVAKSQQQLATLGISAISVKDAITKDQNEGLIQLNNALAEKEKINLEIQKLPYYIAARQEATARMQAILDEKQISDANKALLQDRMNKAGAVYGMAPPTVEQFKMMTGPMRSIWEQLIISQDAEEGRLANTPALSINNANKINAPLTPGMNDTRAKLMKMMDVAHANPMWSHTKPEDQIYMEDAAIETTVKNEARNIPQTGGLYSPLSLNKMIAANPVTANNPIAKELAPLAQADPAYAADPNDVFKAAFKLIETGKMQPGDAADAITELYKTMQISLNQAHQYQRFALPRLSEATGYNQSVWLGGGFINGGSKIVNLTDKAAVANTLSRSIISRKLGVTGTGDSAGDTLIQQEMGK